MNKYLKLLLLTLLTSILFSVCFSQNKTQNNTINTNSTAKQILPNGYKNAKWGMSPKEVIDTLGYDVQYQGTSTMRQYFIIFNLESGKEVKCNFYEDQFYSAEYNPSPHDGDEYIYDATLDILQKKYGKGVSVDHGLKYIWEDDKSIIKLSIWDPEPFLKNGVYPSSTIFVSYKSKKIMKKMDIDSKIEENNIKKDKQNSIINDLQ